MNHETERGTGSAATMHVTVITCGGCGKAVTPAIPCNGKRLLADGARVECAECALKAEADSVNQSNRVEVLRHKLAEANVRAEKAERDFKALCQQTDQRESEISDQFTLLANAQQRSEADAERLEAKLAQLRANFELARGAAESVRAEHGAVKAQLAEANRDRERVNMLAQDLIGGLEARLGRLRAAVEKFQWTGKSFDDNRRCPECRRTEAEGEHARWCFIGQALGPAAEQPAEKEYAVCQCGHYALLHSGRKCAADNCDCNNFTAEQPADSDAGLVWPKNEVRRVKGKRGKTYVRPPFVISDDGARVECAECAGKAEALFNARITAEYNLRQEENAVHDVEMEELEAQLAEANSKRATLCSLLKDTTAQRDEADARIRELEGEFEQTKRNAQHYLRVLEKRENFFQELNEAKARIRELEGELQEECNKAVDACEEAGRDRDIWKKSRDAACLDRDELSEKLEAAEARLAEMKALRRWEDNAVLQADDAREEAVLRAERAEAQLAEAQRRVKTLESQNAILVADVSDTGINRVRMEYWQAEAERDAAIQRVKLAEAQLAEANARAEQYRTLLGAAQTANFDKWGQANERLAAAEARESRLRGIAEKLWERLNRRRCYLIELKRGLADVERLELDELQALADEYINVMAPLPIETLEEYMRERGDDAARLREVMRKVEEWFAGEAGPIYRLWENLDICNYDNRECEWEEALSEVRDFNIPSDCVGYGTEWPAVALYREILQVLLPDEQRRAF